MFIYVCECVSFRKVVSRKDVTSLITFKIKEISKKSVHDKNELDQLSASEPEKSLESNFSTELLLGTFFSSQKIFEGLLWAYLKC